jgi:hypothetical protein
MPADGDALTFQHRLRHLIATVYPPSQGRPYTLSEIANGIAAMGGDVKYDYLKLLYDGVRTKPSLAVSKDICRFFGVKLDDFFGDTASQPDAEALSSQLELARLMADAGVVGIAYRANGLSEANVTFLKNTADHLRMLEGLEPVPVEEEADQDPHQDAG